MTYKSLCFALVLSGVGLGVISADSQSFLHIPDLNGVQRPQRKRRPQTPPSPTPAPQTPAKPVQGAPHGPGGPMMGMNGGPKPYAEVVTKEAKTQTGVVTIHTIKDQYLFEIPKSAMNRDLLWYSELADSPSPASFGSYPGRAVGERVLRFEKDGDRIYIRQPDYGVRAARGSESAASVNLANVAPIIASFDVLAYNKDGSPVIDATRLYSSDFLIPGVRGAVQGAGIDPSRSRIIDVKDFPENVEANVLLTYIKGGGPSPLARLLGGGGGNDLGATVRVHTSLIMLPRHPMMPRLKDSRIGIFSQGFTEFGTEDHRAMDVAYVNRFKLEKKNPGSAESDVKEPITFYLGREIPAKWRPWLKKAIENWKPVFAAAGFDNAIVAKDAPTRREDPNWDPEDVRYSTIRWAASTVENAMGPSVQDPRSGQTLSGHVIVWDNVLQLAQDWYFVQASPNDPSAQKLPLSDEKMGRLLEYVVTHEVGHVLGLEHNFVASSQYSIAQLRDPKWTAKNGDEASIMDYGRFNYVTQPGDGAALIPIIGPYDYYAIKYDYMPAMASTPEGEKPMLDQYLGEQVSNKYVRFGNSDSDDPRMESEDLSNDPVEATTLGLKNLDRVAGYIIPATTKYGEDFSLLDHEFSTLLGQRFTELIHVSKLVGGIYFDDNHSGRGADPYHAVPKAKQEAAVDLLLTQGLNLSPALTNPAIIDKISTGSFYSQVTAQQGSLLRTLMADTRLSRMMNLELEKPDQTYTISDMLKQVQGSVWSETHEKFPTVSLLRSNLQDSYLELMNEKINGAAGLPMFKALAKDQLRRLDKQLAKVVGYSSDDFTRAHLQGARDQIKAILDGKTQVSSPTISLASLLGGLDATGCDYDTRPLYIEGVTPEPQKSDSEETAQP